MYCGNCGHPVNGNFRASCGAELPHQLPATSTGQKQGRLGPERASEVDTALLQADSARPAKAASAETSVISLARQPVPAPQPPAMESAALSKDQYVKGRCIVCHGTSRRRPATFTRTTAPRGAPSTTGLSLSPWAWTSRRRRSRWDRWVRSTGGPRATAGRGTCSRSSWRSSSSPSGGPKPGREGLSGPDRHVRGHLGRSA